MKALLLTPLVLLISNPLNWKIVSTKGPEPRYINKLVSTDQGLLMFGGKNSTNNGFDDLWLWQEGEWQLLGNGATKRWDHSFSYNTDDKKLILFGGRSFSDEAEEKLRMDLGDTWVYKNNNWVKLEIEGPSNRSSHAMTYDQKNGKVVMFGGRNEQEILRDTWIFDGAKWVLLEATGPAARYGHTLVYDEKTRLSYLFGGFDGKKLLNDFWTFNGQEWIELSVESGPSARMAHTMKFDNQGEGLLFSGWDDSNQVSDEMWIWKENEWSKIENNNGPQARLSAALGFNNIANEFILFGGSSKFGDGFFTETWRLKN